jgi:hypothetical protein
MPYREPALGPPIEDGPYEDLPSMLRAIVHASRRLGLPVVSADRPKAFEVGFEVGGHRWTMRASVFRRELRQPEFELMRARVQTRAGRVYLAMWLTSRA